LCRTRTWRRVLPRGSDLARQRWWRAQLSADGTGPALSGSVVRFVRLTVWRQQQTEQHQGWGLPGCTLHKGHSTHPHSWRYHQSRTSSEYHCNATHASHVFNVVMAQLVTAVQVHCCRLQSLWQCPRLVASGRHAAQQHSAEPNLLLCCGPCLWCHLPAYNNAL
jgi:hypothetical protein